jgi:hypothetical protein
MADKNSLNTIIVLRNDKSTQWANSGVILQEGEVGVSYLDNGNVVVKAGNGKDTWKNLKQVEGVFEEAVTLTKDFGYFTVPAGGSKKFDGTNDTINTAGMTTTEFLMAAFKQTIEPTIKSYPAAKIQAGSTSSYGTASYEIGGYITKAYFKGSLDKAGSYETNGVETASGITASDLTWSIQLGDDETTKTSNSSGSFTTNIQVNEATTKTYATVKATATLSLANVKTPVNNLGDENTDVVIKGYDAAGTTEVTLPADVKATGYRNSWYYVGTDYTTSIDETFIRDKGTAMNTSTPNFNIASATAQGTTSGGKNMPIPQGTKRVMFVVPGNKSTISGKDIDGMELAYDGFVKKTVRIKGLNGFVTESAQSVTSDTATENQDGYLYTVFVKENAQGLAATGYTVTIS